MKRSTLLFTALAFALWAVPVFAQGKSSTGPGHAGGGMGHGSSLGAGPKTSGGGSSGGSSTGTAARKQRLDNFFKDTDSKLYSKISALATKDGTSITALQGMGFKNLGRMNAALHVYNNLGLATKTPPVSFADFAKAAQTKSLGAAIKKYDPSANSSAEAKKGTKQASDDSKES